MRNAFALMGAGLLAVGCGPGAWAAVQPAAEAAWSAPAGRFKSESLAAQAARLEGEGSFKAAARVYRRMAAAATSPSNRAFALVRQADCHFAAEQFHASWQAYDAALKETRARLSYAHILGRLRLLASGFLRGEGAFLGMRNVGQAIDVYERILEVAPSGPQASADRLLLAGLYAERGDLEDAKILYREVIKRNPGSPDSMQARIAIGKLLVQDLQRSDADGQLAREARSHLSAVEVAEASEAAGQISVLLRQTSEALATRLYNLGEFYTRQAHYRPAAARRYLADVKRQYPDTQAAVKAAELLVSLENLPVEAEDEPVRTLAEKLAEPPAVSRVVVPPEPGPEPEPVKPGPQWRAPSAGDLRKWLLPLEDLGLGED